MSGEDALAALEASRAGLTGAEAETRLARHGRNVLPEAKRRSLLAIALSQLRSPLIYLLLAAAAVSIALGEGDDAIFIFVVLAVNTSIGTVQESRAESNTAALRSFLRLKSRVLRNGHLHIVDAADLTPGDIVVLEAGDKVPADLRILHGTDVRADESTLTGESLPVGKAARQPLAPDTPVADRVTMLHTGTTLVGGRTEGLVVATGLATELGRIAGALGGAAPPPPLTRRLDRFTQAFGLISVVLVLVVVGLELFRGSPVRETFFVAAALAVSIIPEGLPVAVTVALSIATRRMARRNVIVRNLPAVEGLGACTIIATDKTGTLTVNRLTARRLWLPGEGGIDVGGSGDELQGAFTADGSPLGAPGMSAAAALARSVVLCNDADLDPDGGEEDRVGDTVDLAFLVLAIKAGVDIAQLRRDCPRLDEVPFSAERRYAAVLSRCPDGPRLDAKGASEVLLALCRPQDRDAGLAAADAMAADGYRVLAVVTRADPGEAHEGGLAGHLHDMRLLGLVGFIDPLRPEAREAVEACRAAGVGVKMITGDHPVTARAIARDLGMAVEPADVMTGAALADADPARIGGASVFARVDPGQKHAIVSHLQENGEIVAVTGDGVNDAPSLQKADLGVAMGKAGTDVARDAADLVLTDDNFASVVAGIEEGRAAYANIRKVIYLLIATGAAEVVIFLFALAADLPLPLTAIQLLWLNLVTNGGQDVALAFEKAEPDLLRQPPRAPRERIFDALMIRETIVSGTFMGIVASAFWYVSLAQGMSEFEARNILLFLMVAFENAQLFNCRSETRSVFRVPLSNNWPVLFAVGGAQVLHIAAAFIPGLRGTLEVAPISVGTWLVLVPAALSVILVMEIDKALRRRAAAKGRG